MLMLNNIRNRKGLFHHKTKDSSSTSPKKRDTVEVPWHFTIYKDNNETLNVIANSGDSIKSIVQAAYTTQDEINDLSSLGLYSDRLGCQLTVSEQINSHLIDGDILRVSHRNANVPTSVSDTWSNKMGSVGAYRLLAHRLEGAAVLKKLHKGENVILVATILPYENESCSVKGYSNNYPMWQQTMTLSHEDANASPKIQVEVKMDTPNGIRESVGFAEINLRHATEQSGVPTHSSCSVFAHEDLKEEIGKLEYDLTFHPRSANSKILSHFMSNHLVKGSKHRHRKTVAPKSLVDLKDLSTRARGKLSIELRDIHICNQHCSALDGHAVAAPADASTVLRFSFENSVNDIGADSAQLEFHKEWEAHSMHSELKIELLKKTSSVGPHTSKARKLEDGKLAENFGTLRISLFELIERAADRFSLSKWPVQAGPQGKLPKDGFNWFTFRKGKEEIGLALLKVHFTEQFSNLLNEEAHPDASHLNSDELSFELSTIKRNLERLDTILASMKPGQLVMAKILDWDSPVLTIVVYLAVIYFILNFPSANWPVLLFGGILLLMASNLVKRLNGSFRQKYIKHNPTDKLGIFQPVAKLRVAPISASNLSTNDKASAVSRVDPLVKIYYEGSDSTPAHLISQSESLHATLNPVWGGSDHHAEKTAAITKAHNAWFRDLVNHLTIYEQDAILHDIVEPWSREDGTVDTHAYKYPLLQPTMKGDSGVEKLVPWTKSSAMVRFDIVNASPFAVPNEILGRVRVPIRKLVTEDSCKAGGKQPEFELSYRLSRPSSSVQSYKESASADEERSEEEDLGVLTVRLQLLLRNPNEPVSIKDRLAQDAMLNIGEMDAAKELSLLQKYQKVKDIAKAIQNTIGSICSIIECFQSAVSWAHPWKSLFVFVILFLVAIVVYLVPIRYILLVPVTKRFTRKFHQLPETDGIRIMNLITSFPSAVDLNKVFYWQNQEFLKEFNHTRMQVKLQASWAGTIWKKGEGFFGVWHKRYAIIRGSRLEYWVAGIPPKSYIVPSNVIENCTSTERKHLPRDTFGLVIYDVEKVYSGDSTQGHRRLVALPSEKETSEFVQFIRKCGASS